MKKFPLPLFALLIGFLPHCLYAFDQVEFEADTRFLTSTPHRLSGTPEFDRAADYVLERLKEEGVEIAFEQAFLSAQTEVLQSEIELLDEGGSIVKTLPLFTLRPNGVMPPSTYEDGISGPIVYAGTGGIDDFVASPEGAIVVLDYNSGNGWLRAFRLGAKAVVFLGGEETSSRHAKHVETPVNMPRYFYDGRLEDILTVSKVRIRAAEVWKRARGRNIIAYFPGKRPKLELALEEVLILAAPLDSFGAVPRKSPGARGAATVAGMIQWASDLQANRVDRHVMMVFWDNDARGHMGAQGFFNSLATPRTKADLDRRQEYFENEIEFFRKLDAALKQEDPLDAEPSVRRELMLRLRRIADREVAENRKLRRDAVFESEKLAERDSRRALLEKRIEELDINRRGWSELKRALADANIVKEVKREFDISVSRLKEAMVLRQEELKIEGDAIEGSFKIRDLLQNKEITLAIDVKPSDRNPEWGAMAGGFSHSTKAFWDYTGLYSVVYESMREAVSDFSDTDAAIEHFQLISVSETLTDPSIFAARYGHVFGSEVGGVMGIQNILFAPAHDDLSWLGTPNDSYESLNLPVFLDQLGDMHRMVRALGDSVSLSVRSNVLNDPQYLVPQFTSAYRRFGPIALYRPRGSLTADTPTPGAMLMIVHTNPWPKEPFKERFDHFLAKPPAYDDFFLIRANEEGSYGLGPIDSRRDLIWGFAFAFDERGNAEYASHSKGMEKIEERIALITSKSAFFVPPPRMEATVTIAYDAQSDSRLNESKSLFKDHDGVIMVHYEEKVDRVKAFSKQSFSSLNMREAEADLGGETDQSAGKKEESLGIGYDTSKGMPPIMASHRAASDLIRLNDIRLDQMRSKGVFNSSIDELHGQAGDLLKESSEAATISEKDSKAALAYHISRSVYTDTLRSIKDLVLAVIILLLLAIPFAFALERLLFGAAIIYQQLWGFVLFFAAAFAILYWTHPAFAISATPLVIFLGFIIVLLSSLVIVIIMRKFKEEFLALQGMSVTVHTADVSRLGTMMAAMSMGISTMRRRPMRTALTISTIVLLTFTLLTFSSFGGSLGIIRGFENPLPAYSGVQVKKLGWERLDDSIIDVLQGRWGQEAVIAPRTWVTGETRYMYATRTGLLLSSEDMTKNVAFRGALGLSDQELEARRDIAELLGSESLKGRIWITSSAASRFGVKEGETVFAAGRRLEVGRLLEARDMLGIADMDGSSILPVDLASYEFDDEGGTNPTNVASFRNLSAESVAIISEDFAYEIGGFRRIAHIYTESAAQAALIADDLTKALQTPISVTLPDGVYRQIFGTVIAASGIRELLLPIILGGMVIFGTMLGSVADREKEIYTFSALGLAPPHVASLFFAEALVFSIIGGLGGYLFSQILNKGFAWLAQQGLMPMPEINFSSFNAVITLVIVMLVVLASSIYPAIKASRSANPGVMRKWKLPTPQGDMLEMLFPFTVSVYDITGVVSFLKEHYDNCTDAGLGDFITMESSLLKSQDGNYGLRAKVALAPFDLGVTQEFELTSHPSELPGVDEVKIRIQRLSGQPKDWARLNKNLVNDLRKQFLIWRSLPRETMEEYRQHTLQSSGEKEVAV